MLNKGQFSNFDNMFKYGIVTLDIHFNIELT